MKFAVTSHATFPYPSHQRIPPPRNARTLVRPRVNQILSQALEHRLTILQAEAGYGKSTALAELSAEIHGDQLGVGRKGYLI
ncbi:MAG: hypothetical protein HY863_03275 [Chloroflexi bacterium]|nr:hypothetical protein [Chloroflexota bacterium]